MLLRAINLVLLGTIIMVLLGAIILESIIYEAVGTTPIGGTSLHGGNGAGVSVAVDTTVQQGS